MYPQPLLFNFYQLCIFIWLHLLGFSLYCVFSNVYSNHLPEKMHSNISYICLTHCVLSNVSWNFFHGKRNSNTGCICLTFSTVCFQMTPQIDVMRKKTKSHWLHLFDFSPLCVFKCWLKDLGSEQAKSHWLHLFDFSSLCVFKCIIKLLASEHA